MQRRAPILGMVGTAAISLVLVAGCTLPGGPPSTDRSAPPPGSTASSAPGPTGSTSPTASTPPK
ncbi:MAG: hypothetical protein QM582_08720, partial [Micropruina sp.]